MKLLWKRFQTRQRKREKVEVEIEEKREIAGENIVQYKNLRQETHFVWDFCHKIFFYREIFILFSHFALFAAVKLKATDCLLTPSAVGLRFYSLFMSIEYT